ncbi:MAG: sigma-70 family RNA polymerase sigma factor [Vreelandella alkaliphila]|uniref:RNA polymerase subunit sigma n=1 Tax=Halomonas campaniensis TaxID=213554 RepID=A0A3D0KC47_9GAMM|nr:MULTISPECIES: sigma-70 family RNA polymerase sigma factor [unclassified Halomonas]WKD28310.1 sigma-70 family RNA polymerase sigma factor [Halomonas sp. KG2]HBP40163.1 RNA polymerase subunit sigma [Halomonas sp.]HBS82028.1 RNA polymerase subunit sigma [Halomonas campaniensis]HCA00880.1 RNA polymerase subunit sigma [Halomonas campaniensis]
MSGTDTAESNDIHQLYCDHHAWLHNWLRHRLGCSHHAADLAHDTYLRILKSRRTPTADQARSHLIQIAKGLVIDRYRKQRIEQAYLDALAQCPEAFTPSPEESWLAIEALVRIDAMLSGLKPLVRETFLLSRFDGLTYSAIAVQLGISVATVRNYMLLAVQACVAATQE